MPKRRTTTAKKTTTVAALLAEDTDTATTRCPSCRRTLKAAGARCRHCNAAPVADAPSRRAPPPPLVEASPLEVAFLLLKADLLVVGDNISCSLRAGDVAGAVADAKLLAGRLEQGILGKRALLLDDTHALLTKEGVYAQHSASLELLPVAHIMLANTLLAAARWYCERGRMHSHLRSESSPPAATGAGAPPSLVSAQRDWLLWVEEAEAAADMALRYHGRENDIIRAHLKRRLQAITEADATAKRAAKRKTPNADAAVTLAAAQKRELEKEQLTRQRDDAAKTATIVLQLLAPSMLLRGRPEACEAKIRELVLPLVRNWAKEDSGLQTHRSSPLHHTVGRLRVALLQCDILRSRWDDAARLLRSTLLGGGGGLGAAGGVAADVAADDASRSLDGLTLPPFFSRFFGEAMAICMAQAGRQADLEALAADLHATGGLEADSATRLLDAALSRSAMMTVEEADVSRDAGSSSSSSSSSGLLSLLRAEVRGGWKGSTGGGALGEVDGVQVSEAAALYLRLVASANCNDDDGMGSLFASATRWRRARTVLPARPITIKCPDSATLEEMYNAILIAYQDLCFARGRGVVATQKDQRSDLRALVLSEPERLFRPRGVAASDRRLTLIWEMLRYLHEYVFGTGSDGSTSSSNGTDHIVDCEAMETALSYYVRGYAFECQKRYNEAAEAYRAASETVAVTLGKEELLMVPFQRAYGDACVLAGNPELGLETYVRLYEAAMSSPAVVALQNLEQHSPLLASIDALVIEPALEQYLRQGHLAEAEREYLDLFLNAAEATRLVPDCERHGTGSDGSNMRGLRLENWWRQMRGDSGSNGGWIGTESGNCLAADSTLAPIVSSATLEAIRVEDAESDMLRYAHKLLQCAAGQRQGHGRFFQQRCLSEYIETQVAVRRATAYTLKDWNCRGLSGAAPSSGPGSDVIWHELFRVGRQELKDPARRDASRAMAIGWMYFAVGERTEAEAEERYPWHEPDQQELRIWAGLGDDLDEYLALKRSALQAQAADRDRGVECTSADILNEASVHFLEAQARFRRAEKYWREAAVHWKSCGGEDARLAEAIVMLAQAVGRQGRHEEAFGILQRAPKVDPVAVADSEPLLLSGMPEKTLETSQRLSAADGVAI